MLVIYSDVSSVYFNIRELWLTCGIRDFVCYKGHSFNEFSNEAEDGI